MVSNKVRNFGEPGLSSKKMETECMMLWSNLPPSPRIGLRESNIGEGSPGCSTMGP